MTNTITPEVSPRFRVPRVGTGALHRERLTDILHKHVHLRVHVISAHAGCGKTTLLSDFVGELDVPVCWYTIDAADEDPALLLEAILEAVRSRFPHLAVHISPTDDATKDAPRILNALAREISALPDYLVFVLEDYHAIARSAAARKVLDLFVERIPDNCHVIITSRTRIELPAVEKLVVGNVGAVLTPSRLSFTPGEVKGLGLQHGLRLSDEDAEKFVQTTGGWAIGVLLGARGLQERSATTRLPELSRRNVFRYMATEIFEAQTPEMRRFLLSTSTLEELDPDIIDELLPPVNARKMLSALDAQDLFLQCVDEEKGRYRYHQLFRDFLQEKLLEEDPTLFRGLHAGAATLYEADEHWQAAVSHFITARSYDNVARLARTVGADFHRAGKWVTVSRWLDALPRKLRNADPNLALVQADGMVHLGRTDEAVRVLTGLLETLTGDDDWLRRARALSLRSAAFRLGGFFPEARTDIGIAIRLLEHHKGPAGLLGDAHRRLGNIHGEQGRYREALGHFRRALDCYSSILAVAELAAVHNSLGITYRHQGQMAQALMHFEKAKVFWLKTGNTGALGSTLNNLGLVYQRLGQYQMALASFRSGLEKARESGYRRVEAGILVSLGDVLRDVGHYPEAMTSYQEGLELSRHLMEATFSAYATAGMGETYRALGDCDRAELLLKEALHQAEEQKQPYEAAVFAIPLGILEYERGEYTGAAAVLQKAVASLQDMGDKDSLARACFHMAQARFLARDYDAAAELLGKVSGLADELGYDAFLVTEGKYAVPLLQLGAARGIGKDRFTRALERINTSRHEDVKTMPVSRVAASEDKQTRSDIEVCVLGQTKVIVGSREVGDTDWRSSRARELFVYLLVHRQGQTRDQITAALWPDLSPAKTASNFHINLFRARKALFPGVFSHQRGRYAISPNLRVWFDADEFEKLLAAAEAPSHGAGDISPLEKAVDLYRGTFLPGFYGDWVEEKRRELENAYLRCLSFLAERHTAKGNHGRGVALLEKLVAADPYQEETHLRLIQRYLAQRNKLLALRAYEHYVDTVAGGQDADTSPEMQELHRRILATEPSHRN